MRKRILFTIATMALVIVAGAFFVGWPFGASEASAKSTPRAKLVYVSISASARKHWPVVAAAKYVDRYTGSRIIFGNCRTGYKCIIVREANASPCKGRWAACANLYARQTLHKYDHTARGLITLKPSARKASYAARLRLVTHEFGHMFGMINFHSKYCTNVMYHSTHCAKSKKLTKYRFSDWQRNRLRVN